MAARPFFTKCIFFIESRMNKGSRPQNFVAQLTDTRNKRVREVIISFRRTVLFELAYSIRYFGIQLVLSARILKADAVRNGRNASLTDTLFTLNFGQRYVSPALAFKRCIVNCTRTDARNSSVRQAESNFFVGWAAINDRFAMECQFNR